MFTWHDNSQMHRRDKYSQHSSIILPVWPNGWVFVYQLNSCGFGSRCTHLNFRYRACFEQGILDIQANIECGFNLCTWHDNKVQSIGFVIVKQIFLLPKRKQSVIIIASQVAEELMNYEPSKLENVSKISKLYRIISWCLVHLQKWNFCQH